MTGTTARSQDCINNNDNGGIIIMKTKMENSLNEILKDLNRDLSKKIEHYTEIINDLKESANSLRGNFTDDDNYIEHISKLTETARILKYEIKTIEWNISLVKIQLENLE